MAEFKNYRARQLDGYKSGFKYAAAGCVGGVIVAVIFVGPDPRLPGWLFFLSLACYGWACRMESRSKLIENLEAQCRSTDPLAKANAEFVLPHFVNEPVWKIMLPWN
jgi:hypothetical protein